MRQNLFSVPLYKFHSSDEKFNSEITPLIYSHLEKIEHTLSSIDKNKFDCSKNGLTSFYGPNLANVPEFNPVKNFLLSSLTQEYQELIEIQNFWFTVYKEDHFIPRHTHPNSQWSGVYYVKAEKDCGDINFFDPSSDYKNHCGDVCSTTHRVTPQSGMFVTFPSWLAHQSEPNKSSTDRIIISFNFYTDVYDAFPPLSVYL